MVHTLLDHEGCACTGRGLQARRYTPLVSRVVMTLSAASFGDGLLHLGLASVRTFLTRQERGPPTSPKPETQNLLCFPNSGCSSGFCLPFCTILMSSCFLDFTMVENTSRLNPKSSLTRHIEAPCSTGSTGSCKSGSYTRFAVLQLRSSVLLLLTSSAWPEPSMAIAPHDTTELQSKIERCHVQKSKSNNTNKRKA